MRCEMGMRLVGLVFCVGVLTAPASGRIIYVDGAAEGANDGSSWADAYVHLQDALAEAGPADKPIKIRVAQGVYTPRDRNTPFELINGVTLKGGFAGNAGPDAGARDLDCHTTTLTGDPGAAGIVNGDGTDATAVLDGFTISALGRRSGVAITSGEPTFINCCFVGTPSGWGAIYALECHSTFAGCRFEGYPGDEPHPGEGLHCEAGHLTLRDCVFVGNRSEALSMVGTLDISRCLFESNRGRVVYCAGTLVARDCAFVSNGVTRTAVQCVGDGTFTGCHFLHNAAIQGGPGALVVGGDIATLTGCVFAGNSNLDWGSGAIHSDASALKLTNCLFVGNSGGSTGPGAVWHHALILQVSNCTFADNRGEPVALKNGPLQGAVAELTQCIVRGGTSPLQGAVEATYSNVEGGYAGEGNIDVEPHFVDPGYWDANGTPGDPNDDLWIMGGYHLKSQAGHWDRQTESWILDDATSPCIDAGDPDGPLGGEPFPNGGYVNLGAYGGTSEASRSYFGGPVCETQIAGDINGDCNVDDLDMDILMSHWLMDMTTSENTQAVMGNGRVGPVSDQIGILLHSSN